MPTICADRPAVIGLHLYALDFCEDGAESTERPLLLLIDQKAGPVGLSLIGHGPALGHPTRKPVGLAALPELGKRTSSGDDRPEAMAYQRAEGRGTEGT